MARRACCVNEREKKGAWSSEEDELLAQFVKIHGEGKWRTLAEKAGLRRSGKSCRLRWLNYLRPGIKRGDFSWDEEELILKLHRLLGNRWALIAGRLPGRTDNEIKNYWNTILCKKVDQLQGQTSSGLSPSSSSMIRKFESEEENNNHEDNSILGNEGNNVQTNAGIDYGFNTSDFSIQIGVDDQNNYDSLMISSMEVFKSNEVMISDTMNFESFHGYYNELIIGGNNSTCIPVSNCKLESEDQKVDTLQDMEIRKIASLLDIENEFRDLL
ncbi:hypothetical protein Ddye_012066 [Dipteronia dyeriana]|uniref:Uncharacterized protein n=1 Tax=Dipteronia dyeriana TaxID=168575 RepID=A0AAE0CI52_9ROSI|nr:hypothetical protein Ddye_012066 [Dipteronia dyeriana]